MHRALPEAVVELDAVGGSAAEEGGVEEVGAARAPGHRNAAGGSHGCEHRLDAARDLAAGTRDHHADRVGEMAPGVVTDLVCQRGIAQAAYERDDGLGRAGGRMKDLQSFGVGHRNSSILV